MSAKSHHKRTQYLQKRASDLLRQLEIEEQLNQQQRLREQVLADICQVIDGVQHLRRTQQHAQQQHQQQQQLAGTAVLQAVLQAVPSYCCAADLLHKATPELVAACLALSADDIGRLLHITFHEILALNELITRTHEQFTFSTAPGGAAGVSCCASNKADDAAAAAAAPQPQAGHMAELQAVVGRFCGALLIVYVLQPLPLVQAASINHRTQEQQEPAAQHLQDVAQRLQLSPAQAAYLQAAVVEVRNVRHSTWWRLESMLRTAASPNLIVLAAQHQHSHQRAEAQQHEPKQRAPDPPRQDCPQQHPQARRSQRQRQRQQAPQPDPGRGDGQQQEVQEVRQASTHAAPLPPGPQPCFEERLQPQVNQLLMYSALTALLVLDQLTLVQRARWIVASWPYVPAPVVLCNMATSACVAPEQQAAAAEGSMQTQGAAGSSGQQARVAAAPPLAALQAGQDAALQWQMQHLKNRRQHWWQRQQEGGGEQASPDAAVTGSCSGS